MYQGQMHYDDCKVCRGMVFYRYVSVKDKENAYKFELHIWDENGIEEKGKVD